MVALRVISVVADREISSELRNTILPLPRGVSRLGRDEDCHLILQDPTISRHHCTFHLSETSLRVEDNSSLHGLWINGVLTVEAELEIGDSLRLGQVNLAVELRPLAGQASVPRVAEVTEVAERLVRQKPKRPTTPTKLVHGPAPKVIAAASVANKRTLSQRLTQVFSLPTSEREKQRRHISAVGGRPEEICPHWLEGRSDGVGTIWPDLPEVAS